MSTSRTRSFLTEIIEGTPIPVGKLEYFRARLQSRVHQLVLAEYLRQEDRGLRQIDLARRISRKPEIINRLLGAPGNWTINTVSDLLLGMGVEPTISVQSLEDQIADRAEKWGDSDEIVSSEALHEEAPVANTSFNDNG
jgi:hypothetical protein